MNFLLIPDSFKGTLSSTQVCQIMSDKINALFDNAIVKSIPVADGGEGSVDCFLASMGGEKVYADCHNPYMEQMQGFYGLIDNGKTAVIEMSACAGLPMVENRKNPLLTTTYGVGELINDACNRGVKKIIMGLGGSCTNDFGCGCASACGIKFFDKDKNAFVPTGKSLIDIKSIDYSGLNPKLNDIEIVTMCDIDNPPFGINGASYVFAPQKGADNQTVQILDKGVKHLCEVIKGSTGVDLSNLSGGGAAGAMGAGMVAFFNSKLKMGIDTVLDTVGFDNLLNGVDYVFTGEGKIDGQSLRGKVVMGVARRCKQKGVPVIAVVGGAESDLTDAYNQGVTSIFTINKLPQDFSISRNFSSENLAFTMENILRLISLK